MEYSLDLLLMLNFMSSVILLSCVGLCREQLVSREPGGEQTLPGKKLGQKLPE